MPPRASRQQPASEPPSAGPRGRVRPRQFSLPRVRLPRPSRRQLLTTALAVVSALGTAGLIDLIWPLDSRQPLRQATSLSAVAKPAARPVTVLVIGLDSDRLSDDSNNAAPSGAANADALMLVRINPDGPVQALQIPATLAVQLPGESKPRSLGSIYRSGGPALTADAVRELAGLPSGQPDRYLVISRHGLRLLASGLGGVEANPSRTMRHSDRSQTLTIDLQSGLQRLSPVQVEHLARWRDPSQPLESRLSNLQEVAGSLHRELGLRQNQLSLPELATDLLSQVQTNLTRNEALSLLVTALEPGSSVEFTALPLAPRRDGTGTIPLRERVKELPSGFWMPAKAAVKPS